MARKPKGDAGAEKLVTVEVLHQVKRDGVKRKVGEEFDLSLADARTLEQCGFVRIIDGPEAKAKAEAEAKAKAEAEAKAKAEAEAKAGSQTALLPEGNKQ